MNISNILCFLILSIMIFLTHKKLTYGVCIFLAVRILVPENVRLFVIDISLNTSIIFVLTAFTFYEIILGNIKIKFDDNFIKGVILTFLYCLFSLFLSNYSNIKFQLHYLIQFFITDILPCVLALLILQNKKDTLLVIKTILISCFITTIYGIVSYIIQYNPYIALWTPSFNLNHNNYWYGNYTTSTFVSTNSFGYFIGISFPFVAFLCSKNIYKKYSKLLLSLLLICAFLAKKRTTIVVLLCYGILWFFCGDLRKKSKYLLYRLPIIVIALFTIFVFPCFESIKNLIMTSIFFWNDSIYKSVTLGNGGSDWALRLKQLSYPFDEIKNNFLFGNGFGWCAWYLSRGVIHPVLFGFETLPAQALCEFGILSFLIYPLVFLLLFRYANSGLKNKYIILFFVTSIIQMFGTGANYWYLELIYILLMRLTTDI